MEKEVELTDEEIAEEIVKALVNTKKSLEDLHEDDDDYDKLSLLKKINNSSLWLIQRLLNTEKANREAWKIQEDSYKRQIAEQKAEIERLKKGQAESAKTAVEVLEQNIELQKQVEYWESETKIARRDIDEAVKDTAKEIIQWIKRNGTLQYGGYVIHDSTIEQMCKKYGVEVE